MPRNHSHSPPLVPKRFAGLWIAWDHKQTRIVASARSFAEARQAAIDAGEPKPLLAKAPRADVRFVGTL
jgi:hypothetical protein